MRAFKAPATAEAASSDAAACAESDAGLPRRPARRDEHAVGATRGARHAAAVAARLERPGGFELVRWTEAHDTGAGRGTFEYFAARGSETILVAACVLVRHVAAPRSPAHNARCRAAVLELAAPFRDAGAGALVPAACLSRSGDTSTSPCFLATALRDGYGASSADSRGVLENCPGCFSFLTPTLFKAT